VRPTNNAAAVQHVLTADLHRVAELPCPIALIDFGRHEVVEAIEDIMSLPPIGTQQWDRCRQLAERIDTSCSILITQLWRDRITGEPVVAVTCKFRIGGERNRRRAVTEIESSPLGCGTDNRERFDADLPKRWRDLA